MPIEQRVGNFQIVAPIAKGGMGKVYLARHHKNGRQIAIKVLPDEFLKSRKRSQYLEREVKIAQKLKHPNVIDIYGLHVQNKIGYLCMEYMDGGNLRPLIRTGNIKLYDIIELVLKICEGLLYIHHHKLSDGRFHSIIHRDIKPENILLSQKGDVKVADFGLSVAEEFWRLRRTKSRAGTPLYMSPEQIRRKPMDIRTDIYSLGLVIYELLTGQLPYKVNDKQLYLKMVANKKVKPSPPSHLNKDVPRQFDEVTLKALETDPSKRYQTMAEMRLDLQRLPAALMQTYDPAEDMSGGNGGLIPEIEIDASIKTVEPCEAIRSIDDTGQDEPASEPSGAEIEHPNSHGETKKTVLLSDKSEIDILDDFASGFDEPVQPETNASSEAKGVEELPPSSSPEESIETEVADSESDLKESGQESDCVDSGDLTEDECPELLEMESVEFEDEKTHASVEIPESETEQCEPAPQETEMNFSESDALSTNEETSCVSESSEEVEALKERLLSLETTETGIEDVEAIAEKENIDLLEDEAPDTSEDQNEATPHTGEVEVLKERLLGLHEKQESLSSKMKDIVEADIIHLDGGNDKDKPDPLEEFPPEEIADLEDLIFIGRAKG